MLEPAWGNIPESVCAGCSQQRYVKTDGLCADTNLALRSSAMEHPARLQEPRVLQCVLQSYSQDKALRGGEPDTATVTNMQTACLVAPCGLEAVW